jgi:hypothetical protein
MITLDPVFQVSKLVRAQAWNLVIDGIDTISMMCSGQRTWEKRCMFLRFVAYGVLECCMVTVRFMPALHALCVCNTLESYGTAHLLLLQVQYSAEVAYPNHSAPRRPERRR